MMDLRLKNRLTEAVARERRAVLAWRLAACWAIAGLLAGAVMLVERGVGWASFLTVPVIATLAVACAFMITRRHGRAEVPWRPLARKIEARFPELDGRLLTAVQQEPGESKRFGFLQERVINEVLHHSYHNEWAGAVPGWRLAAARTAQLFALLGFLGGLAGLMAVGGPKLVAQLPASSGVTVIPGDIQLEKGSSLVVMARFATKDLPPSATLVILPEGGPEETRLEQLPLAKSLSDPVYGGQVSQVESNFLYRVEYAGGRTRDFKVEVFEYPRLERADATLTYPDYTGQAPRRIEDTRRLSAVEGSRLDLQLKLNKAVAAARLVPKEKTREPTVLVPEGKQPIARLDGHALLASESFELHLVDFDGRTNKVPARFVFDVLKNRAPQLRLTWPRGDIRPSPVEEVSFEGTAWDDFGVEAFGIGYALVGQPPRYIELGRAIPGKQKYPFQHTLRLEDLGVEPDQLVSWFVWADDKDPAGELRRTPGDLFFAEIRPFDEIFREGQDAAGGMDQEGGGGGQGGRTGQLAQVQKQILNATWNLQRQRGGGLKPPPSGNSEKDEKRDAKVPDRQSAVPPAFMSPAYRPIAFGQVAPGGPTRQKRDREIVHGGREPVIATNLTDAEVVRDAQEQLLEQVRETLEMQADGRMGPLWREAAREMERALERLEEAVKKPKSFEEALAAEQAAYQALLRLQEHEYQVSRARRQNRGQQGGGGEQMQRQLDQLDLTQSENRYETQRMARRPQTQESREQLQVMNRLQELARRQQDLNERLRELQAALAEARTEAERDEIRRRLKRLQEEERQMLADLDELRQRMERPENQSEMAEERRQLDQAREEMQRAAEAAERGETSQALASGTRAQRQLQDLREQMRRESASEFAEAMRDMRSDARELAQQQEEILQQLNSPNQDERRTLSDSPREQTLQNLTRQRERLTNIVDRATEISEQAEASEPLLSRELYDSVRKFSQDTAQNVKDVEDQLLERGLMTRDLYERLQDTSNPDGAKLFDVTSEMLRLDIVPQARETARQSQENIETLRHGIERAAESILGDETEALRLAEQELNELTDQIRQEIAQSGPSNTSTSSVPSMASGMRTNRVGGDFPTNHSDVAQAASQPGGQRNADSQPGDPSRENSDRQRASAGQESSESEQASSSQQASDSQQDSQSKQDSGQRGSRGRDGRQANAPRNSSSGGGSGPSSFDVRRGLDRVLDEASAPQFGPITGDDFVNWSDRLRDVEEMIDYDDLRNGVAAARERARLLRQDFKREGTAPDWAVVELQIVQPLVEVRDHIREELARRASKQELVPIDRDPVPTRFSELVRRYYEQLGKDK